MFVTILSIMDEQTDRPILEFFFQPYWMSVTYLSIIDGQTDRQTPKEQFLIINEKLKTHHYRYDITIDLFLFILTLVLTPS